MFEVNEALTMNLHMGNGSAVDMRYKNNNIDMQLLKEYCNFSFLNKRDYVFLRFMYILIKLSDFRSLKSYMST